MMGYQTSKMRDGVIDADTTGLGAGKENMCFTHIATEYIKGQRMIQDGTGMTEADGMKINSGLRKDR